MVSACICLPANGSSLATIGSGGGSGSSSTATTVAASARPEALVYRRSASAKRFSFLDSRSLSSFSSLSISRTVPMRSRPFLSAARAELTTGEIDSMSASYQQSEAEDTSEEEDGNEGAAAGGDSFPSSYPPEGPKLYVGNLPWTCNSQEVAELFQEAGTVEVVEVIYDRDTGRSRGFGFVTMSSMDDANSAIKKFDGMEFSGRRLRVSFPDRSRGEGPRSRFEDNSMNANKLFVGNLPWGLDDITLENLFTEYGKVLEAKVVYDRESGRSRGFGFVTLSSSDEVNEAISKMDGAEVQGRPLRVNLASERPPARQNSF